MRSNLDKGGPAFHYIPWPLGAHKVEQTLPQGFLGRLRTLQTGRLSFSFLHLVMLPLPGHF